MAVKFFRKIWPRTTWARWQRVIGILSVIGMGLSLWYASYDFGKGFDINNPIKVRQAVILSFWVLMPPVWFWFEYFFLYPRGGSPSQFDEMKHGQDQSAKVWLALVTVLLGLYFGKDLARDSSPGSSPNPATSSGARMPE